METISALFFFPLTAFLFSHLHIRQVLRLESFAFSLIHYIGYIDCLEFWQKVLENSTETHDWSVSRFAVPSQNIRFIDFSAHELIIFTPQCRWIPDSIPFTGLYIKVLVLKGYCFHSNNSFTYSLTVTTSTLIIIFRKSWSLSYHSNSSTITFF